MLKYKTDSLEGVNEAHHDLYSKAEGGGYVLKVEGAVDAGTFNEMKQSNVDLREEAQRRRRTNERWSELGESPEAVREALNAKGKPNEDHEALVAQMKSDYSKQLAERDQLIHGMRADNVNAQLINELNSVGFHPEAVDMVAQTAKGRIQFDDEGKARIMRADGQGPLAGSGADGYATLTDLAKEMAAAKPSFLVDGGLGGGGKTPANGSGNPQGGGSKYSALLADLPLR